MPNLLFYPAFQDSKQLFDQVFRTIWHFAPMADRLDRIVLPYRGDDELEVQLEPAISNAGKYMSADFEAGIADFAGRFKNTFQLCGPDDLDVSDLAGVLVWDTSDSADVRRAQDIAREGKAEVVLVDPLRRQQETLETIRFAYSLWNSNELATLVENSYQSFCAHADRWQGRKISAFGNGPSLGESIESEVDIASSVVAVCNSTIGDTRALEYLKPELLFCGDPVQHCGVSLYAGQFRRDLKSALEDPNRVLFTQLGYVPYFREVTPPSCHDRIVGIGNDRRPEFNLDLRTEYLSAATANIFTMLVLPVSCTISNDVDIYGCDGMSFAEATKPWSHAGEDDYMSKMAVTHRVHSGFWQRNYEEEYWSYCRDMSDFLTQAEARGVSVSTRTPSFVPALAQRFDG